MSEPAWPFPGSDAPPRVYDLPPPAFALGDRVRTRWGAGTVCGICDWPITSGRAYNVHHDFSSAPSNFGHLHGEDELERFAEEARNVTEEAQPAWAPLYATGDQAQQEMFA